MASSEEEKARADWQRFLANELKYSSDKRGTCASVDTEEQERKKFCRAFVLARAGAYSEGEMRLSVAWENARKCWKAKPEDL